MLPRVGQKLAKTPRPRAAKPAGPVRNQETHQLILAATWDLLEERGYHGLTIEGVASRAGVGKTTIYRWWSSKGALAMEAFLEDVAPSITFPVTDSARNDLLMQIHKVASIYRGKSGKIVREMIALGQFDPATMQSFVEGYLEPRRSAAKEVLMRGI